MKSRRRAALIAASTVSVLLAACGSDSKSESAESTPAAAATTTAAPGEAEPSSAAPAPEAPAGEPVSGEVVVSGSSTVQPISSAVAELFAAANPDAAPSVDGPGTGDGFKLFCAGDADVTGASRTIKDEEAASCADAGVNFVELKVGLDGLTVATSPNNTAIECLDNAALYALLGPESEGLGNWSDANALATELGSKYTTLPDAPLDVFGPGEESGTYDTFVEFAIADLAEERGQEEVVRADYSASPNDNVIVQGIEGADTSIGWVGFAYFVEQGDKMRAIAVADDAGTCVTPSVETVSDGSYPFSRELYIYVNVDKAKENPAVKAYVDLYLSDAGIATVSEVGYVAEAAEDLEAARGAWTAAVG
jgi:phosphate transport system substrate-binding protein